MKVVLLRLFGAHVGRGVVIKPRVRVKYPWKLTIGDFVWIGEDVWLDNLAEITIGNHVCISQGAYLLTGNHNYKERSFDLRTSAIHVRNGSWIGARGIVCPGVEVGENAVLTVGSIATKSLQENSVYSGNPAEWKKSRL